MTQQYDCEITRDLVSLMSGDSPTLLDKPSNPLTLSLVRIPAPVGQSLLVSGVGLGLNRGSRLGLEEILGPN